MMCRVELVLLRNQIRKSKWSKETRTCSVDYYLNHDSEKNAYLQVVCFKSNSYIYYLMNDKAASFAC